MKRVIAVLALTIAMTGTGNLRAADFSYSGSVAGSMMSAMWEFMEWFLGKPGNSWRPPHPTGLGNPWAPGLNNPYTLYANALGIRPTAYNANPYRYRDYWDDPANPWVGMQPMDGVWRAQSGEHWYVRGNHFVLVSNGQQRAAGEFIVEGNFLLVRMPAGEVEFEFRQMDDVMMLRDVAGRIMLLQRVESGGWRW